MKKEYDFSKGQRGKFSHENAKVNIPVYLEGDVEKRISEIARQKGVEVNALVNLWLKKNLELIGSAK